MRRSALGLMLTFALGLLVAPLTSAQPPPLPVIGYVPSATPVREAIGQVAATPDEVME